MNAQAIGQSLPERVAILEAQMEDLKIAVATMVMKEGHIESAVNTIMINFATLNQAVTSVINERTVWKNPMVYISIASVILAGIATFGR